jgi:hypothetical protein
MTRKDTFKKMLDLTLRHGKELNELLLDLEGKVGEDEFVDIRAMAASIMGEILLTAINPIVREFPDLKPEALNSPVA